MDTRITWTEGLLLTPIHLQQSDRYFIEELHTRAVESQANNSGFFYLDIDQQALSAGQVSINEARGIFPDGSLFNISKQIKPLDLKVTDYDIGKTIFLVLPRYIQGSVEVQDYEADDPNTRYLAYPQENIANSYAGQKTAHTVLGMIYNFQLCFESDLTNNHITMEVCKIQDVSSNGIVKLARDFQPVYRHLSASQVLIGYLNEISSLANHRIEQIGERLQGSSSVKSAELSDYLMLQLMMKTKQMLYFLLSQSRSHPMEAYLRLAEFYGELVTLSSANKTDAKLLKYEHYAQKQSFELLINEIRSQMSSVLEQSNLLLPMENRKNNIYVSEVADISLYKGSSFVLMVTANMNLEELKVKIPKVVKIGTPETIRHFVNFSLPGYTLEPLAVPPRQIPASFEYCYFKINLSSEEIGTLERSAGFALHVTGEIDGLDLKIWSIRE